MPVHADQLHTAGRPVAEATWRKDRRVLHPVASGRTPGGVLALSSEPGQSGGRYLGGAHSGE
jgi:hypothetical protein